MTTSGPVVRSPGVTGVHLRDRALLYHLLGQQEKVSSHILELVGLDQRPEPGASEFQMTGNDLPWWPMFAFRRFMPGVPSKLPIISKNTNK